MKALGGLKCLAWFVQCITLCAPVLAAPPAEEVLRIAVHISAVQDASRVDIETSLGVWTNELSNLLEVPSDVRFYDSLAEIRRDFNNEKINFVIADPISLVRQFEAATLADGFGGGGQSDDIMVLIVRAGSGIQSSRDLVGKRVVLLADHEISKLLLETSCLKNFRQTCAKSMVKVEPVSRSRQQVLKLFFGNADAAIVRSYVFTLAAELNPQILAKVAVVERYPVYGGALGMFSSRVSPAFRDFVIAKAPHLADYPRGRQLMSVLQTASIRRIPRTALDPVRALIAEHDALALRYGGNTGAK